MSGILEKRGIYMNKIEVQQYVKERLFELQDLEYKTFHSKLMPTIDSERIIGIRTPMLRKFAREFAKTPEAAVYLEILPHDYYEENNLHGMLLDLMKDYDKCLEYQNQFITYIDNWATCDLQSMKICKKHKEEFLEQVKNWLESEHPYTVRFAIRMLMSHYLDEDFSGGYPEMVVKVQSEEYYVKMMVAWYFATALAKQYDAVIPYIEEQRLEKWTHNKTIQKAIESYRITDEQKEYLRKLKIK